MWRHDDGPCGGDSERLSEETRKRVELAGVEANDIVSLRFNKRFCGSMQSPELPGSGTGLGVNAEVYDEYCSPNSVAFVKEIS